MEKILLDTNMFIYLEDFKVTDEKVMKLTKRLYDSDEYKIVIHPKTREEILKMKDETKKEIFLSKIAIYKEIKSPPKASSQFHNKVGCHNEHDRIDNELLFSIYRNCAKYLITNDQGLLKKAKKVNLDNRVLSIEEALIKFKEKISTEVKKPIYIEYKYLHELDINDSFFDSLKQDYDGFEEWFITKQEKEAQAYVTEDGKNITSFLMMKIEDEDEDYSDFFKPFKPGRRLKISTLKVVDTGKRIGESFIKIIVEEAINQKVDEVYVTVFDKQEYLIEMLESYGFKKYTKKNTKKADGTFENENVLVKDMKNKDEFYPFFSVDNKRVFIVPIREEYHNLLFQESEKNIQLNIDDYQGKNTASNSLKKAYLCNSNIKQIRSGDILLFYSSRLKKAITSLGIVDAEFHRFENFDDMYNLVKKRTAYEENELRKKYKNDKLVIMFKLYYSFDKYVSYDFLKNKGIVKGPIQTIKPINVNQLFEIFKECKMNQEIYLINKKV